MSEILTPEQVAENLEIAKDIGGFYKAESSHEAADAVYKSHEALRAELALRDEALASFGRELPCGSHPRLESMGKPARFSGGCDALIISADAIVCADCGAWYCSRDCIRKHFGDEPDEAISKLEGEVAELRADRDRLLAALQYYADSARAAIDAARAATLGSEAGDSLRHLVAELDVFARWHHWRGRRL